MLQILPDDLERAVDSLDPKFQTMLVLVLVLTGVRRMLSCHFTAQRLQRYLDADPSAPLDPAEIRRVEAHLAECARCASAVADFRSMRSAMLRLSRLVGPDPRMVARLHRVVDQLLEEHRR